VRHLAERGDDRRPSHAGVDTGAGSPQPRYDAPAPGEGCGRLPAGHGAGAAAEIENVDMVVIEDVDMVVIEEDMLVQTAGRPVVAAVRLGDYRRLFARLRRGG